MDIAIQRLPGNHRKLVSLPGASWQFNPVPTVRRDHARHRSAGSHRGVPVDQADDRKVLCQMLKHRGSSLIKAGFIGILVLLVIAIGLQPARIVEWASNVRYSARFDELGGLMSSKRRHRVRHESRFGAGHLARRRRGAGHLRSGQTSRWVPRPPHNIQTRMTCWGGAC